MLCLANYIKAGDGSFSEDLVNKCVRLSLFRKAAWKAHKKRLSCKIFYTSYLKTGWKSEKSLSVPAKAGRCQGFRRLRER